MPGPMDYDQIIANALQNINPMVNTPPPSLYTGQPLIPQSRVASAVDTAMTPGGAPVTPEDKSMTLARIGMALMQPRMPGQSVAGNIGNSVKSGLDYYEGAKARAQNVATQQANTALTAEKTHTDTRLIDTQLQAMAGKYPMEVAELQQKLRKLALEGKTQEYQTIVAAIKSNPELVMKEINADIKVKESHSRYYDAYADWMDRGGRDKVTAGQKQMLHSTKSDDGSVINTYVDGSGNFTHEIVRPGVSDMQTALKIAEKELKKENSYGWFSGPTPQQIQERAQQLMTPKVLRIDDQGRPVQASSAPTSAKTTAGTSAAAPQTSVEDDAAALVAKGGAQGQTVTVSGGPAPKAAPKGGKEVWTPGKIDELLNAPGTQTPEPAAKPNAEAPKESVDVLQKRYNDALGEVKSAKGVEAAKQARQKARSAKQALDAAKDAAGAGKEKERAKIEESIRGAVDQNEPWRSR